MTRHREDRADLVVEAIRRFTARWGFAPSVREITELVGLTSTGATQHHIQSLVKAGRVTWQPGIARSLRVVEPPAHHEELEAIRTRYADGFGDIEQAADDVATLLRIVDELVPAGAS